LEQENNLHIKGIARPKERDYEMPCTTDKSGRQAWHWNRTAKGANTENSKELLKTFGFPDITHATKMRLKSAGTTDAAKSFHE
jgi:hypothetical protein